MGGGSFGTTAKVRIGFMAQSPARNLIGWRLRDASGAKAGCTDRLLGFGCPALHNADRVAGNQQFFVGWNHIARQARAVTTDQAFLTVNQSCVTIRINGEPHPAESLANLLTYFR